MATRNARRRLLIPSLMALAAGAIGAAEPAPIARAVGQRMANFTLKDTEGTPVTLYGFRGKKAVVLAFMGTDCPVANLYMPRLYELNKTYSDWGVVFLAINSNAHETVEQVAAHARQHGIDFPVLKDVGNLVADLALVERTCEVLVLDGRAQIRYRGAIDDQYTQGARKASPAHPYLRQALDAVLAGEEVETPATAVAGCLLDRAEAKPVLGPKEQKGGPRVRPAAPEIVAALKGKEAEEPVEVGAVTFAADVARIVQEKCQSCHRPGQVGPFSLRTYDDARRHSATIREVVDDRRMPPWHADPRHGHFRNDRSLTPRERATLLTWVDRGSPLGDPQELPAPKEFPEGWSIGTPDLVFEIPEPYTVSAQGVLPYVNLRVPANFKEDRWIQAAEAVPGDRSVVHHIIVYVEDHAQTGRRGPREHLCGYAPGDMPSVYPPGTAKKIPAGSDLLFQIHYTPSGTMRTDRSKVGLIFAKAPVTRRAHTLGIAQQRFLIPPGASSHPVSSTFRFPTDSHVLSFMPHMHLRGKSFEYKATYPDGSSEVLLSVPAYDFGWQSYYTLAEPKAMPRGSRIDCLAHFDNSAENPANPDPTKGVIWGEQTFEEMMIGYIDYVEDAPIGSEAPAAKPEPSATRTPPPGRLSRLLRILGAAAHPPVDSR